MAYKGLPEKTLKSTVRAVAPVPRNPVETRELLDQLRKYPVYGLLLTPDANHAFTKMTTARWDELHHMTGNKFLLLAFQPPATFSREFKSSWQRELGKDFDAVWSKWQKQKTAAHGAYDFQDMFADRSVRRSEMPCLALFTSPEAKRAAILRVPDWSDEDVWKFLEAACDTIDECAGEPDPELRLAALQSSLTSFPARAKSKLGHVAAKAEAYVSANPVRVAITTLSIVIALSTASIIPIGAVGITFMKDIAGILKSAPRTPSRPRKSSKPSRAGQGADVS
jgi:hypothetical protein